MIPREGVESVLGRDPPDKVEFILVIPREGVESQRLCATLSGICEVIPREGVESFNGFLY